MQIFLNYYCKYNNLHQFSFNMPQKGAEMNGSERLLCASSMRKGIKKQIDALDKVIEAIQMYLPFATK